jgi:ribose 5-phosphate isomerase B
MIVAVGSDHAGFEGAKPHYKPAVIERLKERGDEVLDCGCDNGEAVDYPDPAARVAKAVQNGQADRGVLICGTGMGVSIAANRYEKVRAAVCCSEEMVSLAREHNDANVLCVGRRTLTLDQVIQFLDIFLETKCSDQDRHARRVAKLG